MKLKPLLIVTALCFAQAAAAESQVFDLLDKRIPIAEHIKRHSPVKFGPVNAQDSARPGVSLFPNPEGQPPGVGTYDVLRRCELANIRRESLSEYTSGADAIDIVYYDHSDPAQVKRAETWPGLAVPYLESAAHNPFAEKDRIQCFARVLSLQCLPTRFRYTDFQGRRVSEFREGSAAWELKFE